jgi:omega-6 fatty acid desaturase (delta-12 desaturase)
MQATIAGRARFTPISARGRGSIRPGAATTPLGIAYTQIPFLADEERQQVANKLGFKKIGKELPDDVTLQDVIASLPRDVFTINEAKAWGGVFLTLGSFAACLGLIAVSPWWFLPIAWFIAGTSFTGFFTVGHDCAHRSGFKNKLVEDIVGTIMMAPLIYPYEPWRIKHNTHHAHTNKLAVDTAWHPVPKEEMKKWGSTQKTLYGAFLGTPLKLWASIGHWLIWHFNLDLYEEKQKPRVIVSLAAVFAFMAIGWPMIIYYTGIAGWFKFWFMPWMGYHFWMSAFTLIHHTAPHIPFKKADDWNAAKAQLGGTVHCDFPYWVELLTHDINWHIPHHITTKIPWYNLRAATESVRQNWGQYISECDFNARLLRYVCAECHVYDKENNYIPFDSPEVNGGDKFPLQGVFDAQRKILQ